jgi:hypothetical protein
MKRASTTPKTRLTVGVCKANEAPPNAGAILPRA